MNDALQPEARAGTPTSGQAAPLIILTAIALALGLAGCAQPDPAPAPGRVPGMQEILLESATSAEPAPALSDRVRDELHRAAQATNATALVTTADSDASNPLPLAPRRPNGEVEHGTRRETLIARNVQTVADAVAGTRAHTAGLDLLVGMDNAVRGRGAGTLIVTSSGLTTHGALDFRELGWLAGPTQVANSLRAQDLLPHLQGWHVLLSGIADTAGSQPALPTPTRDKLVDTWVAVCKAAGAVSCDVDATRHPSTPPATTIPMPAVDVPQITSIKGPGGHTTTKVPDALLGFAGDSAALDPAAAEVLRAIAVDISARPHTDAVTVAGFTADPPGATPAGCQQLSQTRADAVGAALTRLGVTGPITAHGGGVAPGLSSTSTGAYNPGLAAQMRRVEITY